MAVFALASPGRPAPCPPPQALEEELDETVEGCKEGLMQQWVAVLKKRCAIRQTIHNGE